MSWFNFLIVPSWWNVCPEYSWFLSLKIVLYMLNCPNCPKYLMRALIKQMITMSTTMYIVHSNLVIVNKSVRTFLFSICNNKLPYPFVYNHMALFFNIGFWEVQFKKSLKKGTFCSQNRTFEKAEVVFKSGAV